MIGCRQCAPFDEAHRLAVCSLIDAEIAQTGAGGTQLTLDNLAGREPFRPIVAAAIDLVADTWGLVDGWPLCWGIRIDPGVIIPQHNHNTQRYTAVYYLTDGVPLVVGGERVEIRPHKLITFAGTDEHWTDGSQLGTEPRYSVAMAF